MDQGFDEFFGFTDAVHAWEKFPEELWDGRELKPVSGYADDLFTDHADRLPRAAPGRAVLPVRPLHRHATSTSRPPPTRSRCTGASSPRPTRPSRSTRPTRRWSRGSTGTSAGSLAALDELGPGRRDAGRLHQRPRRDLRAGQPGDQRLPRQQPAVPRPEADALGRGHPRPGRRPLAGHVPAGPSRTRSCQMTDLFPTFLAAAGAAPDPAWHVDGANLLPIWTRPGAGPPERTLFWEWRSEGGEPARRDARRDSSWSSPAAAGPSCSTSRPTPPSAANVDRRAPRAGRTAATPNSRRGWPPSAPTDGTRGPPLGGSIRRAVLQRTRSREGPRVTTHLPLDRAGRVHGGGRRAGGRAGRGAREAEGRARPVATRRACTWGGGSPT